MIDRIIDSSGKEEDSTFALIAQFGKSAFKKQQEGSTFSTAADVLILGALGTGFLEEAVGARMALTLDAAAKDSRVLSSAQQTALSARKIDETGLAGAMAQPALEGAAPEAALLRSQAADRTAAIKLNFISRQDLRLNRSAELSLPLSQAISQMKDEIGSATVRTADPSRFLMRMPGYGGDANTATMAEQLIATTRDGIQSHQISSYDQLESYVTERYLTLFRSRDYAIFEKLGDPYSLGRFLKNFSRETEEGSWSVYHVAAGPRHASYDAKSLRLIRGDFDASQASTWFRELKASQSEQHVMTTEIDGQTVGLVKTEAQRSGSPEQFSLVANRIAPTDPNALRLVDKRREQLFDQLTKLSKLPDTEQKLQKGLEMTAELEWFNAQTWRVRNGVAGIGNITSRSLLESLNIDTGAYRAGIDPNLEALSQPLSSYIQEFPRFFEKSPSFFHSH